MNKNKVKKFLLGATVVGGMVAAGVAVSHSGEKEEEQPNKDKQENKTKKVQQKRIDFTKKYKIESRADFDTLWKAAKPYVFASLIPSENWRTDFHSDKQNKTINSVGVGLFYVGVDKNGNLDFSSSKWIKTSEFYSAYKKKHGKEPADLTPNQIYLGACGFFESYDDGRALNELFKKLEGTELTINEFAAIVSVYYNSPAKGKKVCKYVCEHHEDSYACARYILDLPVPKKKNSGIKSRRVHETLLYLNFEGYCEEVYNLKVDGHLETSINAGKSHRAILLKKGGFTKNNLHAAKNAICTATVPNGKTIKFWVEQVTIDDNGVQVVADNPELTAYENLYDDAISKYKKGDYKGALIILDKLTKTDYNDANLQNDISLIQYDAGDYKKSLLSAKSALKLAKTNKERGAAFYNMGMACLALDKYEDAIQYFDNSIALNKTNDAQKAKVEVEELVAAKEAKSKSRGKKAVFVAGIGVVTAAAYAGRKRYKQQKHINSR